MPLHPESRSFWKNSANTNPLNRSTTVKEFSPEPVFLRPSAVSEVEEDLVELIEVDPVWFPHHIEAARLLFGCGETSIDPDSSASGVGEQR